MTATAAPAGGATPAPTAPANGATSTATEPAPGTTTPAKPPEQAQAKPSTTEQPWKAKRKLKIGGQEREIEYDDRRLQILEHTASQKAEFERRQSEFDQRMRRLQDDPDGFLEESGFDVNAYLARQAQRAEQMKRLTPEQQENLTLKEQLQKIQQAQQKQAEEARVAAEQREHHEYVQQNVQRLGKAIELSGLPRSGELVRLYAEVQEMAAHAGEPEMSPEQIVSAGERLMSRRLSSLLKAAGNEGWRSRNAETLSELAKAILPALDGEALLSWVGRDNAMRVVKALHAKTRTSPVPIIQEPTPVQSTQQTQSNGVPVKTEWDILDGLGA